jgi:hypothetical protein
MRKLFAIAFAATALPVAALAVEPTDNTARAALDYEGVKCEETGMTKDGLNFTFTCTDGQISGVFFTAEGVASVRRFNKVSKSFDPL